MSKLLKIKIYIETEIVGENVYEEENVTKVGREIFNANRDEIINQALSNAEVSITAKEIDNKNQLPKGWSVRALPFSFAVFGSKHQEKTIEELLKNEN